MIYPSPLHSLQVMYSKPPHRGHCPPHGEHPLPLHCGQTMLPLPMHFSQRFLITSSISESCLLLRISSRSPKKNFVGFGRRIQFLSISYHNGVWYRRTKSWFEIEQPQMNKTITNSARMGAVSFRYGINSRLLCFGKIVLFGNIFFEKILFALNIRVKNQMFHMFVVGPSSSKNHFRSKLFYRVNHVCV